MVLPVDGTFNGAFDADIPRRFSSDGPIPLTPLDNKAPADHDVEQSAPKRQTWDKGVEFLMSCISMSVGLGNVWRFPFTAYKNGGGAFLIPYVIVLFLVGKPIYFMETIMGQFSSKGAVKVYDFAPAMKGAGVGQTIAVLCVSTYYSSLMALILYYFFSSFTSVLPWSQCDASWTDCLPSDVNFNFTGNKSALHSSTEIFFKKTVLRELDNIDDGIGLPEWKLTLCLMISWVSVFLVLIKGVKSSGKSAYFLAIFPYVIMIVLLVKALTMSGSLNGIMFFLKPDFSALLNPTVWYQAVTQCFFSLSVSFGPVVMYASYNQFSHNIYRDTMIVTTMDFFTSLLAGFTIFAILGNLAEMTGQDIEHVVKGGPALAFISYPEAISKFDNLPQFFSALFFLMMFVLGIGANVAMSSSVITAVKDKFPNVKHLYAVCGAVCFGFCVGLLYITPGGQFMLNLVDHHGASFIVYVLVIGEMAAVFWIYGVGKFCDDAEFMLGKKVGLYWRICWSVVTPGLLIIILVYSLSNLKQVTLNGVQYPTIALIGGWLLSIFGIIQLPLLAVLAVYKRRHLGSIKDSIIAAFKPNESWGPTNPTNKKKWLLYSETREEERKQRQITQPRWRKIVDKILGY